MVEDNYFRYTMSFFIIDEEKVRVYCIYCSSCDIVYCILVAIYEEGYSFTLMELLILLYDIVKIGAETHSLHLFVLVIIVQRREKAIEVQFLVKVYRIFIK